jgi:HEAT repeat protein
MKKLALCLAALFFVIASECFGQQLSYNIVIEQQEDSGYKLYKEGYNLILQSNWKDAVRKFQKVLRFYPKSSYRDDSNYWYAYALKYQDEKKAVDALKKFLREFPKSSYRSDALEDLAELQTRFEKNIAVLADSLHRKSLHVQVPDIQVEVYDLPEITILANKMRDEVDWGFGVPTPIQRTRELDENTRLKLVALRGISAVHDTESFRTLREILLDRTEHPQLRIEALGTLGQYREFDIFSTLEDIAKNDPDIGLREGAIFFLGTSEKDKEAVVTTLINVYTGTPKENRSIKERLVSSIGQLRTKKGMDFLVNVAKSDPDNRMREGAIYFIGTYEKDKDVVLRTLTEIYDATPKENFNLRERLISLIAQTRTEKAMDFLMNIAQSNEEIRLRELALYYLGQSRQGKKALYEILKRK